MPDARSRRVREYVDAFNAAVGTSSWADFSQSFTERAVMTFTGSPVPPVRGRGAIRAAYQAQPPDDTIAVVDVGQAPERPDVDVVRFRWSRGGTGTLRLRWRDDLVDAVEVDLG